LLELVGPQQRIELEQHRVDPFVVVLRQFHGLVTELDRLRVVAQGWM